MPDREKIIGLLSEIAEYFRECRSNASFASKAENHFWELQNAAGEAADLLKEQEETIRNLEQEIRDKNERLKERAEQVDSMLKERKPVEPSRDIALNRRCPKCFAILKGKFCHKCGQAVKWE